MLCSDRWPAIGWHTPLAHTMHSRPAFVLRPSKQILNGSALCVQYSILGMGKWGLADPRWGSVELFKSLFGILIRPFLPIPSCAQWSPSCLRCWCPACPSTCTLQVAIEAPSAGRVRLVLKEDPCNADTSRQFIDVTMDGEEPTVSSSTLSDVSSFCPCACSWLWLTVSSCWGACHLRVVASQLRGAVLRTCADACRCLSLLQQWPCQNAARSAQSYRAKWLSQGHLEENAARSAQSSRAKWLSQSWRLAMPSWCPRLSQGWRLVLLSSHGWLLTGVPDSYKVGSRCCLAGVPSTSILACPVNSFFLPSAPLCILTCLLSLGAVQARLEVTSTPSLTDPTFQVRSLDASSNWGHHTHIQHLLPCLMEEVVILASV